MKKNENGSMFLSKEKELEQPKVQRREAVQEKQKKSTFSFAFEKENEIESELRKPRSRAYMEIFNAIDMLSATDEEIMEQLKANMDEDTAEDFSNMTAEELLEEIKACFQEEFKNAQLDLKATLLGVISRCYIPGCDCHAISAEGEIMDHYETNRPLPEGFEKGRIVLNRYPECACIEVYSNCCRVVNEDSSVIHIPNYEI
ncbi:MAG: hypothetical protein K5744_05195 [Eubacterium sp.]|nr:hypothetical protein [Eubacterium sp.]